MNRHAPAPTAHRPLARTVLIVLLALLLTVQLAPPVPAGAQEDPVGAGDPPLSAQLPLDLDVAVGAATVGEEDAVTGTVVAYVGTRDFRSGQAPVGANTVAFAVRCDACGEENPTLPDVVWEFGDGTRTRGTAATSHTYQTPGMFTVTAMASDEFGRWGRIQRTVYVAPITDDLVANLDPDTLGVPSIDEFDREALRVAAARGMMAPCLPSSFATVYFGASGDAGRPVLCSRPTAGLYAGAIDVSLATAPTVSGRTFNGLLPSDVAINDCLSVWWNCGIPQAETLGDGRNGLTCDAACQANLVNTNRMAGGAWVAHHQTATPSCTDGWRLVRQRNGSFTVEPGTEAGCLTRTDLYRALVIATVGQDAADQVPAATLTCLDTATVGRYTADDLLWLRRAQTLGLYQPRLLRSATTATTLPFCAPQLGAFKEELYFALDTILGASRDAGELDLPRDLADTRLGSGDGGEDGFPHPYGGEIAAAADAIDTLTGSVPGGIVGSRTCADGAGTCFNPKQSLDRTTFAALMLALGIDPNAVRDLSNVFPPDAPTDVVATAADRQAELRWTPPTMTGGAALTSYEIQASPGGQTIVVPGGRAQATFTGLANGIDYTFVVRAANPAGTSDDSEPSNTVRPTTQVPVTAGLRVWLDGDDASTVTLDTNGAVQQWRDRSGTGLHAGQSTSAARPTLTSSGETWSGRTTVRFNGTSQFLTAAGPITANAQRQSVFIVHRLSRTNTSDMLLDAASPRQAIGRNSIGEYILQSGSEYPFFGTSSTTPRLLTVVGANGSTRAALDGEVEFLGTEQRNTAWNDLVIARRGNSSADFMQGEIAEVLIYDRPLSAAEVASVETYLSEKWFEGEVTSAHAQYGSSWVPLTLSPEIRATSWSVPVEIRKVGRTVQLRGFVERGDGQRMGAGVSGNRVQRIGQVPPGYEPSGFGPALLTRTDMSVRFPTTTGATAPMRAGSSRIEIRNDGSVWATVPTTTDQPTWLNLSGINYAVDEDEGEWIPLTLAAGVTADTPAGSGQQVPAYRLVNGMVELRGFARLSANGAAHPSTVTLGTLPTGARPSRTIVGLASTGCCTAHAGAHHTVEILSTGVVQARFGKTATNWVSLDGVRFDTPAATGWVNIPLQSGVVTPSGAVPLSYRIVPEGVELRGRVALSGGAAFGNSTVVNIAAMPAIINNDAGRHLPIPSNPEGLSGTGSHRTEHDPAGMMRVRATTTGVTWLSFDGILYPLEDIPGDGDSD